MAEQRVQRRLAAILAADVVGYSRLMGEDETGTLAQLKTLRKEVFDPRIAEHNGRIVKTTGDGVLVEFASAVDATECAIKIQRALARRNEDVPEGHRIELRIGINLGDIIVDGDDIYGDGVNVAARLEGLCDAGEVYVSAVVHDQVEGKIEAAFEDLGEQTVKNIDKPIRVYRVSLEVRPVVAGPVATEVDKLFERPAVAVLPFENIGGDPDQEYFADGLTEDIITSLSLWRSFPVIARNSSFAYKGQSPDIRLVGKELGARYVVEGSVRKATNRIRVTAQLINAETGHHLWAERYDREFADIFALQDELTERIAATVAPEVERAIRSGSLMTKRPDLDAWDYLQRGMAYQYEYTKDGIERARELFKRAIEIDPEFSKAYAALGFTYLNDNLLGFSQSVDQNKKLGLENAKRAVQLDNTEPAAHFTLAIAHAQLGQHEQFRLEIETAVELNPLNNRAINSLGHMFTLIGQPEKAVPLIEKGLRLSPRDPSNHMYFSFMARAYFGLRRYEEAIDWAKKSIHLKSEAQEPYYVLAASLGHLGRTAEGKEALEARERHWPDDSQRSTYYVADAKPDGRTHFEEGLRKAGWEG